MEPMRREMQITADRIRDRLGFVVIIKTGEIAPARIAAEFDEAGADHDAKSEPAEEPDDEKRRAAFGEWPAIEQRTEKDGQETGLEELNFPTVAVPNLADVNDRHVHQPKEREQDGVGVSCENKQRKRETDPGEDRQSVIGDTEPKERRHMQHAGSTGPELRVNNGKKITRGS